MPGVPGFPPGASWNVDGPERSGASVSGRRARLRGSRVVRLFVRVFRFGLRIDARERHKKPPAGAGGHRVEPLSRVPCIASSKRGVTCGREAWMAGRCLCPESPGFHPGLLGTLTGPSALERRSPADVPGCWEAAAFVCSCDFSGFAFGLTCANGTKSPRREPGDTGSNTSPRAMHCGFEVGCHVWS